MARTPLFPRRRPRTPSTRERAVGLILMVVLAFVVAFFAWTGTREGPPGLPESSAAAGAADARLPLTTPGGWPRGALETYDEQSLYEKINGRAEAYTAYAFQELWFATYTDPARPDVFVDAYLYVFAAPLDAFGCYRAQRSGSEQTLGFGDEGVVSGGAIFLRRGRHTLEVLASDEEARPQARALAEALAAALEGSPEPLGDPAGLPEGPHQVRFDREAALGVGGLDNAFVATYEDGREIVVARAADPERAAAIAKDAEATLAMLGDDGTFLARGRVVVGVLGVADAAARRALAEAVLAAQPDAKEGE